ncbi:putative sulfate exporter family transporter [Brevundimonas basaltis]|uniref:Putative integral membrane protein (TIGR00698 family) n=1 Tax=Brevundimonas basaltis TaxID=472166 RepID=A0A7W8MGR8_9CAUL|nr:putative sulfate exporter family transporter [Brevundimonas basaltis]MBB5291462.1 putative integral membrane protein (TIGR00698 family) [Brevundimonas basaltis]
MILARRSGVQSLIPGLLACAAVAVAAVAVQALEVRLLGRGWIDAIVLAILIGAAVRTLWTPPASIRPGIEFSARTVLEIAVVLLGASVSAATVMAIGPGLLVGTALVVVVAVAVSYGIGRLLRLPRQMAALIACGNAICGNSAIAAVAPVIDADAKDVSAAIAFTAVLGVVVVLTLPLLGALLQMSGVQYGVLAGLTVYAVPQVLAATLPVGAVAAQAGTLIKLVRVLMLGPVCLALALIVALRGRGADAADAPPRRVPLGHLLPWFIVGFLLLMGARSLGLIPATVLPALGWLTTALTVLAMAALGLSTDARAVARSGPRIVAVVTLSLLALIGLALGLIYLLALV